MKTIMMASVVALLVAGTAFADEVRVVKDPDANITVHHFQFVPGMMPGFAGVDADLDGDFEGTLTSDEVGMPPEAYGINVESDLPPGFEPDALIYIWNDENRTVRMVPIGNN
jgi:uncharacterized protein (DUF2141 family)